MRTALHRGALTLLVGAPLLAGAVGSAHVEGHPEAPPAAHTGGFGEPSCAACHLEYAVNLPGGRLTVAGLPVGWHPGRRYALTVALVSEEMGAAGFQLAVRDARGAPLGRLEAATRRVAVTVRTGVDSAGVFAHHTLEGSTVSDPNQVSWQVIWVAPERGGRGPAMIHAAANSGNGDNSPFGDLVYLFEALVPEASASGQRRKGGREPSSPATP